MTTMLREMSKEYLKDLLKILDDELDLHESSWYYIYETGNKTDRHRMDCHNFALASLNKVKNKILEELLDVRTR
jgi:hypothetical protein